MTDQCDNCKFVWELGDVGKEYYECRARSPTTSLVWPKVLPTDWCGEYQVLTGGVVNQYVSGTAELQTTEPEQLAPRVLGEFDILVLEGCQVVNTSAKEDCIITFLDGPNLDKPLGFVSSPAHDSRDFAFRPGLRSSPGNSIYAKLDQDVTPNHIYVTAQGFALRSLT